MPERDRPAAPATPQTVAADIAELLVEIEREPVPDKLLKLAQQLQVALRARAQEDL